MHQGISRSAGWRITTPDRVALDGEETRESGGRWHSPGRPLVYSAGSCALATLEFLAHLDGAPSHPLVAMRIAIPAEVAADEIDSSVLPPDWRTQGHPICRELGDAWLRREKTARAAVLRVPSAVVPFECNLLIDPSHPDMRRVSVEQVHDYELDVRVL